MSYAHPMDEIADLRARLTTAEQEREEYASECRVEAQRRRVAENDRDLKAELMERYVDDLAAAEARVEALRSDMEWIAENVPHQATMDSIVGPFPPPPHDGCTPCFAASSLARAALACPPQQRGEK